MALGGGEKIREELNRKHLRYFVAGLIILPLLITVVDVLWAPYLMERYRMDIYWLMGIVCFIVIGFYSKNLTELSQRRFSRSICVWALITVCTCFLLFLAPYNSNYTMFVPGVLEKFERVLKLGFL